MMIEKVISGEHSRTLFFIFSSLCLFPTHNAILLSCETKTDSCITTPLVTVLYVFFISFIFRIARERKLWKFQFRLATCLCTQSRCLAKKHECNLQVRFDPVCVHVGGSGGVWWGLQLTDYDSINAFSKGASNRIVCLHNQQSKTINRLQTNTNFSIAHLASTFVASTSVSIVHAAI